MNYKIQTPTGEYLMGEMECHRLIYELYQSPSSRICPYCGLPTVSNSNIETDQANNFVCINMECGNYNKKDNDNLFIKMASIQREITYFKESVAISEANLQFDYLPDVIKENESKCIMEAKKQITELEEQMSGVANEISSMLVEDIRGIKNELLKLMKEDNFKDILLAKQAIKVAEKSIRR